MNFQEDIKKIKRLASISKEAQELVKQITGKELVSYEGIDALVAALMGFYNAELKKKSQTGHKHTKEEITDFPSAMTPTAHNHDDRYYTENETNDKLKQKLNKGNLPATITDAKGIYDLLENNGGLNIDPNLIFLNDAGTKQVGKVYLDRNKKGLFECKQKTPSTINSVDLFKDISNKSNSDKLENQFYNLYATTHTNAETLKQYENAIKIKKNSSQLLPYKTYYINCEAVVMHKCVFLKVYLGCRCLDVTQQIMVPTDEYHEIEISLYDILNMLKIKHIYPAYYSGGVPVSIRNAVFSNPSDANSEFDLPLLSSIAVIDTSQYNNIRFDLSEIPSTSNGYIKDIDFAFTLFFGINN